AGQAQPNGVAVLLYNPGINAKFRFLPIPDQAYTGVLTYQKAPLPFTAANIAAVEVVSGGAYYVFTTAQPQFDNNVLQGQSIWVQNFDEPSNNGTFTCTASTDQMLTLSNTAAVPDSSGGTAINQSWYPITDSFMHIYNNLFLAEALDAFDDARGPYYRQRGIAAFLSISTGLTEMQKNSFLALQLSRGDLQRLSSQLRILQGSHARGV